MIRKETLTSYDKWVQPTEEEIAEMIKLCGKTVDTTVTSVLQTSAGRMIFARPH